MEGETVGDTYAKGYRGKGLWIDIPLLMGEVNTQIQLRVDRDGRATTKGVNEGVVPDVAIGGICEGDLAFAAQQREVGMDAVDGGLELETANIGALADGRAIGGGHAYFEGGLHNGSDEVGVVEADGVADVAGGTPVGTEEGGLDKGSKLAAALCRFHGLRRGESGGRQQYDAKTGYFPD